MATRKVWPRNRCNDGAAPGGRLTLTVAGIAEPTPKHHPDAPTNQYGRGYSAALRVDQYSRV